MPLPVPLQSYLSEPAVDGAPVRVWRDWALVGGASIIAIGETLGRNDAEWLSVSPGWRLASLIAFFLGAIPSLLIRRTRPLLAAGIGFGITMAFGVAVARSEGQFGGLYTTVVILITLYSLFRWGSGRQGLYGLFLTIGIGIIGNLSDPSTSLEDWVGGFIVLSIPIEVGLIVRYQRSARLRAISDAKSLERAELARELHDTVAHHVSAIAVQAQAGRALATSDPERALGVLAVIEEAASRTLVEMRSMVGTLRDGAEAELAPRQGLQDLQRLAEETTADLHVTVSISEGVGTVAAANQSAFYRIARESITNAVRHARGASTIAVEVTGSADIVTLTVIDDGATAQPPGSGYGLLGMAERVEILGGSFRAGPGPIRGWQVVATLPRTGLKP